MLRFLAALLREARSPSPRPLRGSLDFARFNPSQATLEN